MLLQALSDTEVQFTASGEHTDDDFQEYKAEFSKHDYAFEFISTLTEVSNIVYIFIMSVFTERKGIIIHILKLLPHMYVLKVMYLYCKEMYDVTIWTHFAGQSLIVAKRLLSSLIPNCTTATKECGLWPNGGTTINCGLTLLQLPSYY